MNIQHQALQVAIETAKMAGAFLKKHFGDDKRVDEASQHDIKLELDKLSQALIFGHILKVFPDHALLGEEGVEGNSASPYEWIVDPIDGTVNYYYGIPLYCVSIALRYQGEIIVGAIYDPMLDECWYAEKGGKAYKNGVEQHVSPRTKMAEAIVFIGHGKTDGSKEKGLQRFAHVSGQVRKIRIIGSAALALAYIASGRFDAYVESLVSIWDIAAGKLIVECAGGRVDFTPFSEGSTGGSIIAWNAAVPIVESLGD
ncbi:MAG: inositol monophosphatase [Akkermansiaceae bacterium]|nr:inositol monophosphatase [Akkermansiaceae bacterium]MCD8069993.1 inositol monophosphatase [Akkermansiaceae bacterium]